VVKRGETQEEPISVVLDVQQSTRTERMGFETALPPHMLLAVTKLRKFIGKFTADYKYIQKTSECEWWGIHVQRRNSE
jgi:hypothetical protein